jgi:hypothetical protein
MTTQGVKIGRPKKESTGKTMFIPAHLVKYVMAMLKADKGIDDNNPVNPIPQGGLSDETIANWTSEAKQ